MPYVDAQGCRTYLEMESKLLEAAQKDAVILASPGNVDVLYLAAETHPHTRNVWFEIRGTTDCLINQLRYVI